MSAAENLHRNLSYDNTLIGVVFSVVLIMIDEPFQNSNTINECENSYLVKKVLKQELGICTCRMKCFLQRNLLPKQKTSTNFRVDEN